MEDDKYLVINIPSGDWMPDGDEGYRRYIYTQVEEWSLDGKMHRLNGPARTSYYPSGEINYLHWYSFGAFHREDGPAIISYNKDGSIFEKNWYLDGKILSKYHFTSLSKVNQMRAWELFNPSELVNIRNQR